MLSWLVCFFSRADLLFGGAASITDEFGESTRGRFPDGFSGLESVSIGLSAVAVAFFES